MHNMGAVEFMYRKTATRARKWVFWLVPHYETFHPMLKFDAKQVFDIISTTAHQGNETAVVTETAKRVFYILESCSSVARFPALR